jgi:hypothetical protein
VPLDVLAQGFEHARDRDDDRDALATDDLDDLRRVERVLEVDLAAEELRDEDSHELPEHVAERYEVQKPYRVHQPLPLDVTTYLRFERREVGEEVPVREEDAARLGRRPRREDDLRQVVFGDIDRRVRRRVMTRDRLR